MQFAFSKQIVQSMNFFLRDKEMLQTGMVGGERETWFFSNSPSDRRVKWKIDPVPTSSSNTVAP